MAIEKILNTRILLKNDTLEKWNSSSIILKKGEVALALVEVNQKDPVSGQLVKVPTYLIKVGDGVKTFANLNWTAAMAADVYDWAKQASLYAEGESLTTTVGDKTYTGNAITKAEWDATLNGGKGGLKFTKETQFATKAELDAAIGIFEGDIGAITDTDTRYVFSYGEGNEAGRLKIVATTYTNGVAGAPDTKYVDIVSPNELAEELKNYYTKIEIDNELKKYAKLSGESDITVGDGDSVHTKIGTNKITLASGEEYQVILAADQTDDLDDVLSLVSKSNSDVIVRGVSTPAAENDAANKKYIDDKAAVLLGELRGEEGATYDEINIYGVRAYADEMGTNTLISAKTYADKKASAAETAAKNHAEQYADDIKEDFLHGVEKVGKAEVADKVANKLTVGSKNFDGSAAVTITAADLGLDSAMHFIGAFAAAPTKAFEGTANERALANGDVYLNTANATEYVYSNGKWVELGNEGSHALKTVKVTANEGLTGGGTLAADITLGIAEDGVQAKHIADGVITNAHIASNAAIAHTKISGLGTMATETASNYYTKSQADAAFMDSGEVDAKITALALGTMSKETATDYVKKADATGYNDILTKTAAASAYKKVQTAVADPTASGKSLTFIDTISQDAQGKITATKKNVNLDDYAKTADLPVVNDGNVIIAGNNGLTGEVTFSLNGADPEYSGNIGIADAGVTTAKLASKAVTTAKIADMAVGAAQTKAYQATMPTTAAQVTSEEVWVFNCGTATILV